MTTDTEPNAAQAEPVDYNSTAPRDDYVSLFDRLAVLGEHLPVSHVIADTRVGRFLSAFVHYAEHGIELLDAADESAELTAREANLPVDQRTGETPVPGLLNAPYPQAGDSTVSDTRRDAELARMRAQLDAMNAELDRRLAATPEPEGYTPPVVPPGAGETTVTTEPAPPAGAPGEPPVPAPEPAPGAPPANPTPEG